MKDKLISMAPFFVILALVLGWGVMQGWFTSAPLPESPESPESRLAAVAETTPPESAPKENAPETAETPPPATQESAPATPPPADEPTAQRWSTYHGDTQLAGVIDVALPDAPSRIWRFQANSAIYHGPVASESLVHFVTGKGEVFGVDFKGVKAWSRQLTRLSPVDQTEKPARVDGPVSCFDETVFVGTMAGTLHALNAATGEEKWQTDIDSTILGAATMQPASGDQPARVYVIGQDDGALHCLNMNDGTPLWKSEPIDRCDGSPSSGAGVLAFGSCASALHVISADSGDILHNISLGDDDQVAGGVAFRGSSLFSGSHSGELFHADTKTGEIVWSNTDAESEIFTTPAVSPTHVIFGSMDDNFYALDRANGQLRWKFAARGLTMSPVIAQDKVVVGAGGVLSLLALETGEELWSFEVSDEISSPSIIEGMILVGSDDGSLSAFGTPE